MTRKQVVFGEQDKKILKEAEAQENFSAYIKALIKADMDKTESKPIKSKVEITLSKPKLYTSQLLYSK
ncbi:hypothetical protein [Bacillus sp. JCM 19041]|uniref:hypothetical protein n=1 Tax=Bacillus sp. JCM 19041 TaxID=1460637 RepID=UPI0006CF96F7